MSGTQEMNEPTAEFELTGGALCLDFANTLGDRPRCCEEHLPGYEELLRWSGQAEAVEAAQLEALESEASSHPRKAQAAFALEVACQFIPADGRT